MGYKPLETADLICAGWSWRVIWCGEDVGHGIESRRSGWRVTFPHDAEIGLLFAGMDDRDAIDLLADELVRDSG
jgi:hypothetical protein